MDAASTLFVTTPLIQMDMVAAAGEPGTTPRVMVLHALDILTRRPRHEAYGRGPQTYDWLGFVRDVVDQTRKSCKPENAPLDDLGFYGRAPGTGPAVSLAAQLFRSWGMIEKPFGARRPGDVLLFATPSARAAVMTSVDTIAGSPDDIDPYLGALDAAWVARGISAFTFTGHPIFPGAL